MADDKMPDEAEGCGKCRFWVREMSTADEGEEEMGPCYRYPPSAVAGCWPETRNYEWCGEYSPRRKPSV